MSDNNENNEIPQQEIDNTENNLDFIQDMVSNIPDVQQHVVEAENAKRQELENIVDSDNNKFDPDIHISKDGKPSVTKTGKFRKKKNINNPIEKNQKKVEQEMAEQAEIADSAASAELVQSLKRAGYDAILDFKYDDSRHKIHVEATTKYFVDCGGVKLTPLQSLMVLEGFMALEAARTPKAVSKITSIKAWFAQKYVKFKGRKNNDTQSNNRTDNVGKNNNRKKDSSKENRTN